MAHPVVVDLGNIYRAQEMAAHGGKSTARRGQWVYVEVGMHGLITIECDQRAEVSRARVKIDG